MPYVRKSYTKKSRKTYKKTGGKSIRTYKRKSSIKAPPVDNVITRDFKFIAKTSLTSTVHDCLLGNISANFICQRMIFDIQLIPGLLNWASVYQEFRFDKVSVSFLPVATSGYVIDQGGSTSNTAKSIPRFYVKMIKGNEKNSDLYWLNESQALMDGARSVLMSKGVKMSFVPNQLMGTTDQRTTLLNYVPIKRQWNAFSLTSVNASFPFYGLEYAMGATNSDSGEFLYKVVVKCRFSFRNPQDSDSNIAASVSTISIVQ